MTNDPTEFEPTKQRIRGPRGAGHIEKRKNRHALRKSYQDANGKRVRYTVKTFDTRAEAEEYQRLSALLPSSAQPLSDFLDSWARRETTDLKALGRHSHAAIISKHVSVLKRTLPEVEVLGLSAQAIEEWWIKILSTPQYGKNEPKPYSPGYARSLYGTLRAALSFGVRHELIQTNTAEIAKLKKPAVPLKPAENLIRPHEFQKLLDSLWAEVNGPGAHPFALPALLVAYTGARNMEALGLRWCDIGDRQVHFHQGVTVYDGATHLGPLKTTNADRIVGIAPAVFEALRRHRSRSTRPFGSKQLVFAIENGIPHNPAYFSNWVSRRLDSLGLEGRTSHSMRHTYGSYQLKAEAKIEDVSKMLGHYNPSVTYSIYSHSWDERAIDLGRNHSNVLEALDIRDGIEAGGELDEAAVVHIDEFTRRGEQSE